MSETEIGSTDASSTQAITLAIVRHFGDRVESVAFEWALDDMVVRSTVRLAHAPDPIASPVTRADDGGQAGKAAV